MKQSLLIATALTLAIGPLDLPDAAGLPSFMPSAEASVIIGDRNRIKERPRRNYRFVHVTKENSDPESGASDVRVVAELTVTYADASGQRTIEPTVITTPARQVLQYEFDDSGDEAAPGTPFEVSYQGQTFIVPLGGIDSDADGEIDDMSGTPIPGTDLTARVFARNGQPTKVIRIKGTVVPRPTSGSPTLNGAPANNKPPVIFNIWEGEIAADPRTFDGSQYRQTVTATDIEGLVLDTFSNDITLDPPQEFVAGPPGGWTFGQESSRRRLREKPRRNYKARVASSGSGTSVYAQIEMTYVSAADQGEQRTSQPVDVFTPARSVFTYEFTPSGGEAAQITSNWCGLDLGGALTLNESVQFGDIEMSVTERANGNYTAKIKGPGAAFPEGCFDTQPLNVDGLPAYDRGRVDIWTAEFADVTTDLPEDTVFFLSTDLIDRETGEIVARYTDSHTGNDAPRNSPQLSHARFDRGVQAIVDGRIVADGFKQDETPSLSFAVKDDIGNETGGVLTTNVCHLFEAPGITFADPDSVLDMQYLVELTAVGQDGEDLAYIEHEVVPTDSPEDTTELGTFGQQIGDSPLLSSILINQNEDMETFGMTVSLCGEPMKIDDVAVFMTPLDGGSDVDPEDFTLSFIEKSLRADVSVDGGDFVFGQTILSEINLSANTGNGPQVLKDVLSTTLEPIGDEYDWDSLDIRGFNDDLSNDDDNAKPAVERRIEILKAKYNTEKMRDTEG